jgi:iron transport multicopper oxidase
MFIPVLIASLISSINAAAPLPLSQSCPLSQPAVLCPKTRLTIGNKVIAPDGFERSWVYFRGTQNLLLIFNRATLVDGVFPGPLIAAQKVILPTLSCTSADLTIGR